LRRHLSGESDGKEDIEAHAQIETYGCSKKQKPIDAIIANTENMAWHISDA
jgi:hypothetical protein